MGSEGGRENSERIPHGRVGQRAPSIREPHATSNTAATRSPRRRRARVALSEYKRGATQAARGMRAGRGWIGTASIRRAKSPC